ncbi:hypothetical protein MesoLjLb_73960 [Mesorhizobium sp. L-8-3]|nr:hypothetical protein MesoLjLb_73960 [Mesorhizobium sp. L-8-3]
MREIPDQRSAFGWALPVSLVVHVAAIALLIFGLPTSFSQPQEEQAIQVDLVPPPPEKAEAEPPAKPEQEAEAETPSPEKNEAMRREAPPVVRPVFQFGEKEAGPRDARDGAGAQDGSASPTAQHDRKEQAAAEAQAEATDQVENGIPQPVAPAIPTPRLTDDTEVQEPMKDAKKLFSRSALGGPVATTAMGGVPRAIRVGRLCVTELREQLLRASPPYLPDLLPSESRNDGKSVEISRTAFRANGQWYDLGYRCEVDGDATKVVSFAFRVGDPVPRSEWQRRGLPAQ